MKTFSLILHKSFLTFDMLIQILIIICSILFYDSKVFESDFENPDTEYYIFYVYFIFGTWQMLSFLFYLIFNKKFTVLEKGKRNFYGIVLLIIWLLSFLLFLLSLELSLDLIFIFLIGLLIFSPIIAIYYFLILVNEYDNINKKLKRS